MGRWRGNVRRSLRGRRGQAFLRELLGALDALPEKKLVVDTLEDQSGCVCAIGAVGKARGMDLRDVDWDTYDPETVAARMGISHPMAAEIIWTNDEGNFYPETPEQRWTRVRNWVAAQIID